MAASPQAPLASLQAGRAAAALAVVAFHAGYSVEKFAPEPRAVAAGLSFGYLGVDFFFVLSGFIIYYVNHARRHRPGWTRLYAESRLTRIYIPYWPVGIGIALAYMLLPGSRDTHDYWSWLPTLTLAPFGRPALSVAWTLQHEILFYLLAWAMLRSGRVLAGALLWAAAILAWNLFGGARWAVPFALVNLEFLFGMAAAWALLHRKALLPPNAMLVAAAAACAAAFFLLGGDRNLSVLFGLGLAFLVAALVRWEWSGALRIPAAAVRLGDASYAIYLVHLPLMSLVGRVVARHPPAWEAALALFFLLPVAAGLFYHLGYERPGLRAVRAALGARRRLPEQS
jgi:exopolysaccharide production protein ExoZ